MASLEDVRKLEEVRCAVASLTHLMPTAVKTHHLDQSTRVTNESHLTNHRNQKWPILTAICDFSCGFVEKFTDRIPLNN